MLKRLHLEVNGIVQGVGFRPFIHKLVEAYKLKGWVKNSSMGVIIEVEGEEDDLIGFSEDVKQKSPKLAVIEKMSAEFFDNLKNFQGFKIIKSTEDHERFTLISPDVCICDDCLRELFDKNNRRYRFPFINCTNCGPRFTIIKDIPYDRDKTTMKSFPMCTSCEGEYHDINNRRYHAQPNCCFDCGPELFFTDNKGNKINNDPIDTAKNYLRDGRIIAIKGLGGFHLACDARNSRSVEMLRNRKHRDEKPFALMCRDTNAVKKWCSVSEKEQEFLEGFRRPIVLLKKKNKDILNTVSLDNNYLGVMLPYTAVHYLLMEDELDTLVMTSGNISDFPIISENNDAIDNLSSVADGFLMNNRDIHVKCDDSLIRVFEDKEYPIRRSRGYAPFPIKMKEPLSPILACGGEQKASFALTKDNYIFLSQHIGDMKNIEILDNYSNQIEHFKRMFNIVPEKIACDLHPDYMSTNYAAELSKNERLPLYYVQHHHAHLAACMADNNLSGEVMGIIWDGTGYGTDGTIWGGEILIGDFKGFQRVASIRPISLPGGDKAIKEIYRIGISLIYESLGYIPEKYKNNFNSDIIKNMIDCNLNTPKASSIGRLFDGIASVLGLKLKASYEGQGAIMIENTAGICNETYTIDFYREKGVLVYDWRNTIKDILKDIEANTSESLISAKFMNTLIETSVQMAKCIREEMGINRIVLSGGVFQNMYVLSKLIEKLRSNKFEVFHHEKISTNDEGIAVGQAVIVENGGDVKCV